MPHCFIRSTLVAAALSALLGVPAVQAANGTLDVEGVDSFFELGEGNTVLYADVAPNSEIVAISWDVNLTAYEPSWLSEVSFAATSLDLSAGVLVTIAESDEFSGTQSYAGRFDLAASGQSFNVGGDGVVRVEFYEFFNDRDIAPDSRWNNGTLTFEVAAVPEPAGWLLMAAGLGGLAAWSRRSSVRAAGSARSAAGAV